MSRSRNKQNMGSNSNSYSVRHENDNYSRRDEHLMHNGFLEPEEDEVFHDGKNGYDGPELKLDDIASPFGPSSIREFTFFNYEEIFGPIHIQKKSKIPVLSPNQSPTSPGDEDDLMSPYLYGTPGPASPRSRRRVKKCKSFPFALWEISPGPVWVNWVCT